jgi:hypothetical protein
LPIIVITGVIAAAICPVFLCFKYCICRGVKVNPLNRSKSMLPYDAQIKKPDIDEKLQSKI